MNGSTLALLTSSNQTVNGTQGVYEMCETQIQNSSDDQSENSYPVSHSAFDEEFEVREEENVETPRSCSPSVDELIRKLPSVIPNTKLSRTAIPYNYSRFEPTVRIRSLAELACKPSPYPLDRFYDESIPVRSAVRAINESSRIGSKSTDKPRLTKRSVNGHPSMRLLESIQPRPPIQIPMRSMSSAGLIGDFTGLSFQLDTLSVTDGLLSMPSASKFFEIDQSLLNARDQSDRQGAKSSDVLVDVDDHSDNCVNKRSREHDLQLEKSEASEISNNGSITLLDATNQDQHPTVPFKVSASKLSVKKKVSSSTSKRTTVTKKTKCISNSNNEIEWPDCSLPPSVSSPIPNKQNMDANSGQELVIAIGSPSSDNHAPYSCDFKVESQSNDSGNHSISSSSDINLLLKTEVIADDYTVNNQNNNRSSPRICLPDVRIERFHEDTQIADEEFTLVTNKKMRKKLRSQPQSDKPQVQSNLCPHSLTSGRVRQSNQQTISNSQPASVSSNRNSMQSPKHSPRSVNRPCSNSISFSSTDQPKSSKLSRGLPASQKFSSNTKSTVSNSYKFVKSSGFEKNLNSTKNDFKNKETHNSRSFQSASKDDPRLIPTNCNSSHLNKVPNNPPAPFCIDPAQHRLLIKFLISSWKSFRSNTWTH